MVFPRKLCRIEALNLHRNSSIKYIDLWGQSWISVLLTTHKLMDRLKESTRFWKICWERVHCSMVLVGTRVYHMLSSRTTTVIRRVSRWHLSRRCMDVNVERLYSRIRLEKLKCLDLMSLETRKNKWEWLETIWEWLSPDRRVTLILAEESWLSKLVIMCTWRCHQWEVWKDSIWRES